MCASQWRNQHLNFRGANVGPQMWGKNIFRGAAAKCAPFELKMRYGTKTWYNVVALES